MPCDMISRKCPSTNQTRWKIQWIYHTINVFETVAIIHSFEIVCSSIGCTTIASRDIQLVMNKILQNQIVN